MVSLFEAFVNKYIMLLKTRGQTELPTHSAIQRNIDFTRFGNMRSTQNWEIDYAERKQLYL